MGGGHQERQHHRGLKSPTTGYCLGRSIILAAAKFYDTAEAREQRSIQGTWHDTPRPISILHGSAFSRALFPKAIPRSMSRNVLGSLVSKEIAEVHRCLQQFDLLDLSVIAGPHRPVVFPLATRSCPQTSNVCTES
jgi:hypothetical protein